MSIDGHFDALPLCSPLDGKSYVALSMCPLFGGCGIRLGPSQMLADLVSINRSFDTLKTHLPIPIRCVLCCTSFRSLMPHHFMKMNGFSDYSLGIDGHFDALPLCSPLDGKSYVALSMSPLFGDCGDSRGRKTFGCFPVL